MTWPNQCEGLSIVIPTYNERENIERLLGELQSLGPRLNRPYEVLLVDDSSPDGTGDLAERLGRTKGLEVRVLKRDGKRSLGGATAAGLTASRWDILCVMDADLSHPPSLIPTMVDALDGADGVVASRYLTGSRIESWPVGRRLISLSATLIARLVLRVPCRDPLSGFFLFRRSFLARIQITGKGHKPLLEVLVGLRPVVSEVPYIFSNRRNGESKLNAASIKEFVLLVLSLWTGSRKHAGLNPPADRILGG
jgi:dolichol-phosphate mannosyltransferase